MFLVGAGHAIADASRQDQSEQNGFGVERLAGEFAQRGDHLRDEVVLQLGRVEAELAPLETEHAGRDRSAGHARDPIDLLQHAALVQTPDHAGVKHHGAVTAPGQAEADAWLGSPFGLIARDQLNWSIGHGSPPCAHALQGVSRIVFDVTPISRPWQPQDERYRNASRPALPCGADQNRAAGGNRS